MPFPSITGPPSLARVVGEGDNTDLTIEAHTQERNGINTWAGTANDGTPLNVDGPVVYTKGDHARKEGVVVSRSSYPDASKQ